MMTTTVHYKMRFRCSSRVLRWPPNHQTPAILPTMPQSVQFLDIASPCKRNHCTSRSKYCTHRSCQTALASRLDRRELTITTKKNVLNPILDNIDLIKKDIRHRCDRTAWKGTEITQAYARFAAAMDSIVAPSRCRCKTCSIERADRKIALLSKQYSEAKRWLEALKKYRRIHDLDASSNAASVGR
jgi:hypothetical protein